MINKEEWKALVQKNIQELYDEAASQTKASAEGSSPSDTSEKTQSETLSPVSLQTPPRPEMGDLAFPLFVYAKAFKKSPADIASALAARINALKERPEGEAFAAGPYLNVKVSLEDTVRKAFEEMESDPDNWGRVKTLQNKKIMVEFSGPNTNKPLHLGHVRNDSIGFSISNILNFCGAEVYKVNIINNRGIHICKSMLAYSKFGNGSTPESTGIKGDHFVGDYYVRFAQWEKEDPKAIDGAQELLKKWEEGDRDVVSLWTLMNNWTIEGIKETYRQMGISFDKYYYESDTYKLGKDKVLDGLARGIFQRDTDGSVFIDNSDIGLDKKILLRKDGTSIYITQDIGTAIERHKDWPFDSLVYVVANEQQYHFKVLFNVLDKLGYSWAKDLHHLSYGMVFLPDGKMKSREGTVVDADDLMRELTEMAKSEIIEKNRQNEIEDIDRTSHDIALGAINYYMLQTDPLKDITFNPKESISFNGNTGPYLQYMGARISSMLAKYDESDYEGVSFSPSELSLDDERELLKMVLSFPDTVSKAAERYNPAVICSFLYDMCKLFSHYYHDNRILDAGKESLVVARISLCKMVLRTLKNGFGLVGIPFLKKM